MAGGGCQHERIEADEFLFDVADLGLDREERRVEIAGFQAFHEDLRLFFDPQDGESGVRPP